MRRSSPSPSRSPSPLFDSLPSTRNSSISSECAPLPTKVHLPRTLTRPAHLHRHVQKLRLEGDLAEVPLEYLEETLRRLGPTLLDACNSTTPLLPAKCRDLPSRLPCSLPSHLPSPTQLLAITFLDTHQRFLVPMHSLSLAVSSPRFASLTSAEPLSTEATPSLPVIHLSLPSTLGFPLLHSWIIRRSDEALLQALDACSPIPDRLPSTELPAAAMKRAAAVRGLWANVVAMEMGDEELWELMQGEWSFALELLEKEEGHRALC